MRILSVFKTFCKNTKYFQYRENIFKTCFGYKPPPGNPSLRDFWGEYRIRWRFFLRIANPYIKQRRIANLMQRMRILSIYMEK